MPMFAGVWHAMAATQPVPPQWLAVTSGLAGLLVVWNTGTWRLTRTVITIAHEGGHAVVSLLCGRRLDGIRLHADSSGTTYTRGRRDGLGVVLTAAAGYVTPPLLGAGSAGLLTTRHITAMLWLAVLLLALTLLVIRNAFGVLAVLAAGGAVLAVIALAGPVTQAAFGYVCCWFLLLGGVRPVLELSRSRNPASDASRLARVTGVPAGVWVAAFGLVAVAAAALGAWLLVRVPLHFSLRAAWTRIPRAVAGSGDGTRHGSG